MDVRETVTADQMPQVWDQLRNKIDNAKPSLPPGVLEPDIGDDFSFVFGFVLAITGEGYSYAELEQYTKALRKELNGVKGVARSELWGVQPKVVYLDVSEAQMAALRISKEDILATLALQNMVVDAGDLDVGGLRLRIETAGGFGAAEDIGELTIRRSLADMVLSGIESSELFSRELSETRPVGRALSGSSGDVLGAELVRINITLESLG